MLVTVNQSKNALYSRDLRDINGREDERATFQFIEEIQNCPDLWDVSSSGYKDTKNKQKKMVELAEKLGLKGGK